MSDGQLPVLIIGAGPVGLSLAAALHQHGVPFQVYEAEAELSPEARASTFHPRTLEMFAEWGVLDGVLARGHRVTHLQYWERSPRTLIAEFDYSAIADDTPYPFRLQCPQSIVTRVLKAHLDARVPGAVHMGHRLTGFTDVGTCVEAVLMTPDGEKRVRGAYLCAADGSKSVVRRQLNLSFEGITYADRFLLAATDLDFRALYPDVGSVIYVFDPREWVIVLQLPDVTRLVFQLRDNEDESEACKPEAVRQRIARFLDGEHDYTVYNISSYSVHQRVTDTFRVGRVLLLGDAAHINNPMGGMGMNSGIHDAHNLADKLVRVLAGGDERLLDAYSEERRRYAMNSVQQRTHQHYQDMAAHAAQAREARNQRFRALAADAQQRRAYLLQSSMLEDRIVKVPAS